MPSKSYSYIRIFMLVAVFLAVQSIPVSAQFKKLLNKVSRKVEDQIDKIGKGKKDKDKPVSAEADTASYGHSASTRKTASSTPSSSERKIITGPEFIDLEGWSNYKPKFGTITFDYPSGWTVGKDDSRKRAFAENYFIQPAGQSFDARAGQVVIRLVDPVSIVEDTKSLTSDFSHALFKKFVMQISEGVFPEFDSTTFNHQKYYTSTSQSAGFVTKILGKRGKNGELYIAMMAAAPTITGDRDSALFKLTASLSGATPNKQLTEQEQTVSDWYRALSRGKYNQMANRSCNAARDANSWIKLVVDVFGMDETGDLAALEKAAIAAASKYDFSRMGFYTVGGNETLSVVRVCGNIVAPDGEVRSFYNYARMSGNTNLLTVRLENGEWKVCESAGK